MNKNKLLKISGLEKHYQLPKTKLTSAPEMIKAVDGITFDIFAGETFGLVGESGCGKSTTAKMIIGLLNKTSGQIIFDDIDYNERTSEHKKRLQRQIQMIFQDPFGVLNPRKTIGWFLEEPLKIHTSLNEEARKEKVLKMLSEVGFEAQYYKRYPHELSGGQRQRISIICSLMLNPRLIIADEPVSALDVSVQSSVLNLMKDLQQRYDLTYLFISHDLDVVQYMSDRIAVMYLGKIVEMASTDQLYKEPLHPYTKVLMAAIPSVHSDKPLPVVEEQIIDQIPVKRMGCPFYNRCAESMDQCADVEPPLIQFSNRTVCCHLYDKEGRKI